MRGEGPNEVLAGSRRGLGAGRSWEHPCPLCAPLVSSAVQISAAFFEMKIKLIKVRQILLPAPAAGPSSGSFCRRAGSRSYQYIMYAGVRRPEPFVDAEYVLANKSGLD